MKSHLVCVFLFLLLQTTTVANTVIAIIITTKTMITIYGTDKLNPDESSFCTPSVPLSQNGGSPSLRITEQSGRVVRGIPSTDIVDSFSTQTWSSFRIAELLEELVPMIVPHTMSQSGWAVRQCGWLKRTKSEEKWHLQVWFKSSVKVFPIESSLLSKWKSYIENKKSNLNPLILHWSFVYILAFVRAPRYTHWP